MWEECSESIPCREVFTEVRSNNVFGFAGVIGQILPMVAECGRDFIPTSRFRSLAPFIFWTSSTSHAWHQSERGGCKGGV